MSEHPYLSAYKDLLHKLDSGIPATQLIEKFMAIHVQIMELSPESRRELPVGPLNDLRLQLVSKFGYHFYL